MHRGAGQRLSLNHYVLSTQVTVVALTERRRHRKPRVAKLVTAPPLEGDSGQDCGFDSRHGDSDVVVRRGDRIATSQPCRATPREPSLARNDGAYDLTMADDQDEAEIDPREFMRKMLAISPEDAEDVRRDSPATPARTKRKNSGSTVQEGPTADYGDR